MKIKKGQIVAISSGECSDYSVNAHMRALRDFDSDEEAKRFIATGPYKAAPDYAPDREPDEYGSDNRFIAWAQRAGLWEPLADGELVEWWVGAYGRFEPTEPR